MHESDWFTDDGQKYDWLTENLSGNLSGKYDIGIKTKNTLGVAVV